jgi:hypothetical protein
MAQLTSIQAYAEARQSGLISAQQAQVLLWMINDQRTWQTSAEVLRARVENVNLWRARFTELHDIGAIIGGGRRRCTITGRSAIVWSVAPWPWTPPEAKLTMRELLELALKVIDEHADDAGKAEADRIRRAMRS